MNSLYVIGTMAAGAIIGGAIGVWMGAEEDAGSDLPMAFALYGVVGAGIGTFVGGVAGAVLFA